MVEANQQTKCARIVSTYHLQYAEDTVRASHFSRRETMEPQNQIFARIDERTADLLQSRGITSAGAAIVYAVIQGFTESGGGCYYGTLATLKKLSFSTADSTVLRHLSQLEKAGLICKSYAEKGGKMRPVYTALQVLQNNSDLQNARALQNNSDLQKTRGDTCKMQESDLQNASQTLAKCKTNRIKQNITENITEREGGASAPAHTREEELPEIALRAMQPQGGHEVPTMQEVEAALRNMTVRPTEDKISLCAGYFMDKMDKEEWRTRDWRGALRRYAARWVQRDNATPQRRENRQVPFCQPGMKYKDPGECPF